tara:strand:- start:855 stop:1130 length:276 start_codon:yes stop_codon:yes gene_type:complete
MSKYNENSIKVLSEEEATNSFDWIKVETLAAEYHLPVEVVNRGFEASHNLGISTEYFVDKYIKKLVGIEVNEEFTEVYKDLVRKEYNRSNY